MRKYRTLNFGCCFGVLAASTSWLVISPNSSCHSVGGIADFLSIVQLPATFLATVLSGNAHGGAAGELIYWLLVLLGWSIVGFAVAAVFRSPKRDEKT